MRLAVACLLLVAVGCGSDDPGKPTTDSVAVTAVSPGNGATLVVPAQYPVREVGGVVLPPEAGLISVRVRMVTAHDVPWAQLNVYLLADGTELGYCGQNLPDAPTWQFLKPGWTDEVTVSGFQVYRLPCEVTGVRAMLHMRNNGVLTPPTPSETIAEATAPAGFRISR